MQQPSSFDCLLTVFSRAQPEYLAFYSSSHARSKEKSLVMTRRVSHLVEVGPLLEDLIVQRMRGAAAGLAYMAAIISHL